MQVDLTKMDITIKKDEHAPKSVKTKAEIAFQKRQEATQVWLRNNNNNINNLSSPEARHINGTFEVNITLGWGMECVH